MNEQYDDLVPYGGRAEYNEPQETLAMEREMLIDFLDDILLKPQLSGSEYRGRAVSSEEGTAHERFFEYIEGDVVNGWSWPLVEKAVDIQYVGSKKPFVSDLYTVTVATYVRQIDVSHDPIVNTYELYRCGDTGYTSMREPDVLGATDRAYTTRDATSYDHGQLGTELCRLHDMLSAQTQEDSHQL